MSQTDPFQGPQPPAQPSKGKRAANVRSLNRATAVAVSLSAVAFLGIGSGVAIASAVNAKDSTPSAPLTSFERGPTQQLPQGSDDSYSDGDSDSFWQVVPPSSDSGQSDGSVRTPGGGSHGTSDAS